MAERDRETLDRFALESTLTGDVDLAMGDPLDAACRQVLVSHGQ